MSQTNSYKDFTRRLRLLARKHPNLITTTLSNIFPMRLIENKTHGDLAEIAIAEFINQYMYDFRSVHVGVGRENIAPLLADPAFSDFRRINVLPLIYDEKDQRCNILVFDYHRSETETARISRETSNRGRKHPVYRFYDANNAYICEVRYGNAAANALQRGLWTHTKKGLNYFDSITNGWIDYSHNYVLVKLFSHALVSSEIGHRNALEKIKEDIVRLKQRSYIPPV